MIKSAFKFGFMETANNSARRRTTGSIQPAATISRIPTGSSNDFIIFIIKCQPSNLIKSKMSKISTEQLKKYISEMLANRKQRKFKESVELQIALRDYDPEKDKRFNGAIRLPNVPHPNLRIAIIGNLAHCDQAKANGVPFIDQEGLKKFNKEKKLVKKWAKPYDVLIASDSLMKVIPKLLGNILVKLGKFPIAIGENESVLEKVNEVKQTVRF